MNQDKSEHKIDRLTALQQLLLHRRQQRTLLRDGSFPTLRHLEEGLPGNNDDNNTPLAEAAAQLGAEQNNSNEQEGDDSDEDSNKIWHHECLFPYPAPDKDPVAKDEYPLRAEFSTKAALSSWPHGDIKAPEEDGSCPKIRSMGVNLGAPRRHALVFVDLVGTAAIMPKQFIPAKYHFFLPIHSSSYQTIPPKERRYVNTGISIHCKLELDLVHPPLEYQSESLLKWVALKSPIYNDTPIKVCIANVANEEVIITPGMIIGQMAARPSGVVLYPVQSSTFALNQKEEQHDHFEIPLWAPFGKKIELETGQVYERNWIQEYACQRLTYNQLQHYQLQFEEEFPEYELTRLQQYMRDARIRQLEDFSQKNPVLRRSPRLAKRKDTRTWKREGNKRKSSTSGSN